MATKAELREALDDYIIRANRNDRVRRTLRSWSCVMHLQATDIEAAFTLTIRDGELTTLVEGSQGKADLIVSGTSEDLTNIFWGDENPASNYMQGAITVRGSQEDVMRLDAMAMFIFLKE
ncbi:MAG TPA: SCP2 sterol-binding domain-containing protein [Ktedonobacterales bacterium]|jgi:putative sterol carrier protein|nr:SCP2 sterol-binding domain-containing protein [Ktedonobacterales bacterium]